MGSLRNSSHKVSSSSTKSFFSRPSTTLILILFWASFYLFFGTLGHFSESLSWADHEVGFNGDLREAKFPLNKLCFGPAFEKLKLAVFSKKWPVGAAPGGMERHAFTLYSALAARGHEIHVFTVPSDRRPINDIHEGNLHVYFVPNDHGILNCTRAFEIFNNVNAAGAFDYICSHRVFHCLIGAPKWCLMLL